MNESPFQNAIRERLYAKEERSSNVRFFAVLLCIFLIITCLWSMFVRSFGVIIVDGNSMNQTLLDGQKLLVRFTTEDYQASRGDLIVVSVKKYDFEDQKGKKIEFLIKRLIAVEGDKVRCTDGQVEICYAGTSEYVPLNEPYAYYGVNDSYKTSYDFAEYTVGAGEVFFLGDNRSYGGSSKDSRYQEKMSHLDKLYKVEDIFGVVPTWVLARSCAN